MVLRDHASRTGDEGFSVVEIIVAMTLFSVVATFAAGVLLKVGAANRDAVNRTTAANLAAEQIESIRSTDAVDIPDGGITRTVSRGATTYSIRQTANYLSSGSDVSICSASGQDALAYKLVTVTVRWPDMGNTKPVRTDTLKTLGVGSSVVNATKGALAISVTGATALPADGVIVTLNPGGQVRTTGEDGCAVYTGLTPGTYTASLNMPGYVDDANTRNHVVGDLGVLAGRVVRGGALYTPGRAFTLEPDVPAGYALLPGARYFFSSTKQTTPRTVPTCAEVPAGSGCLTATNVFQNVYPTIYDVWFGSCADARAAMASIDLAQFAAPSVPGLAPATAQLDVRAVRSPSQPVSAQLWAVHAPESGGGFGCTAGAVHALPVTSTSGDVKLVLPPGTWTIQASPTYTSPAPAGSVTVTLAPGTAGTAEVTVP